MIDKTKKEIMSDVYNAQKDIDTLKSIKLNSIDFYEFRNVMQGMINKVDALFYVPEAVKLLGS
jgi:ribosomal protein L30/L7E